MQEREKIHVWWIYATKPQELDRVDKYKDFKAHLHEIASTKLVAHIERKFMILHQYKVTSIQIDRPHTDGQAWAA